ncbi:MAG: M20/M25/M40 family metallo-hydrolase [Gemmatimonadales bacterium]
MQPLIRTTALLLALGPPAYGQTASPPAAAARIEQYVYDLADDSMMGRVTGTPAYLKAATYVAEALRSMGVRPAFYDAGSSVEGYFHEFDAYTERLGAESVRAYNVVGILDGTDPARRNEYVVLGAHVDHISWPDKTQIYNGASDNASGVATVLDVARRFVADRPPQSILFTFFGAEEVGKLGSLAFVDLMSEAESDLLAYINVDDVGHLETESTGRPIVGLLHGNLHCPVLIETALEIGATVNLAVTDIDRKKSFTRSDHYSFFAAGLPVLFFTSGFEYDEYHQPTDLPNTLDYQQLARVVELVNGVVWAITANEADCAVLER